MHYTNQCILRDVPLAAGKLLNGLNSETKERMARTSSYVEICRKARLMNTQFQI